MTNPSNSFEVVLQPIGRRITVPSGLTVLDATRLAGVELVAICGGEGVCGTCRVRVTEGSVSPLNLNEEGELTDDDIKIGYRLACQAQILSNVRIDIPPESFSSPQRLQVEGQEIPTELDPLVAFSDVLIPSANLTDLRSDLRTVVAPPQVTIRQKIHLIVAQLRQRGQATFNILIRSARSRLEIVVTFLAMLELVKRHRVQATQDQLFGDITIQPVDDLDFEEDFELEFGE